MNQSDLSRFKTTLCPSFAARNECALGAGCFFAHGLQEGRRDVNITFYYAGYRLLL